MSSKSTKKTTTTVTSSTTSASRRSASRASREKESTPSIEHVIRSPTSPTRMSRIQERNELQNLNDRLANYIDMVKHLEAENSELSRQIQVAEETVTRESSSMRSNYEKEIEGLRKAVDLANKGKAANQFECGRLNEELNTLKAKYAKKEKECNTQETALINKENLITDLREQLNNQTNEVKRLKKKFDEVKGDRDRFEEELKRLRAELERESLARVTLESEMQSLKNHLKFKEELFQQEITETRTNKSMIESEIETRLQQQHEYDTAKAISELRQQLMSEVEDAKGEYLEKNRAELSNAMERVSDYSKRSQGLADELKETNIRIETMLTKITSLENENNNLNANLKDCDDKLNIERKINNRRLAEKDDEISQLRNELERQLKEYQELMDTKLTLDFEIATYRKLLEGEESRLNISSEHLKSAQVSSRRTPLRGKRKRTFMSEEMSSDYSSTSNCTGEIEVSDQDTDGKYVKLHNKGEKDTNIGGWQVVKKADDKETTFKFHRSVVIKAGGEVTVWSADSGATHNPPTCIVMKGQKWFNGNKMIATLFNNEGIEVAVRETSRQIISSSIIHSSDGSADSNSCSVM